MVCQDMFFSRSRDTPTAAGIMGSDATNARAALESAFRVSRTERERISIVGELLDVKVNQRTEKVSQDRSHITQECSNHYDNLHQIVRPDNLQKRE